ncbi:MAG: ketopantoate reductase family protein [Methanoregula sp.]|jgi:2-dehydropantoate 2-reductase|uniref:ketopantoate reductase family protein n=1 Tax=Methanoregula sp. TaxID=2052170 RepID=UPI0025EF7804|nr:ketopantoate reductase family protein [Methanoregula sp.]MCK9631470.1 ketopantoate reductase family protein [Methanoregula sp.]
MKRPVRILVLGAGAVGLPLAARLSRVAEVVAVTRESYARAISQKGLEICGAWGIEFDRFTCVSELTGEADFDYILITSKSQDTGGLCRQYKDLIRASEVASFQNGIGNEETISGYSDRVIGGVVLTGFVREGDREIRVTANAGPMQIGRFPEGHDAAVQRLADIMTRAGIPVETSDHIKGNLWSKNLINCSLNPLSAITGVTYGELKEPNSWHIIEQLVRETYTVVQSDGISLLWGDPETFLEYLYDSLIPVMAGHTSSMSQDISHGHKTEIDYLNGAVVTSGRRLGVATPYNACVSDLIRFKESFKKATPAP